MEKVKNLIFQNSHFLLISVFYFCFRVINLTKFPIFNDESIYLDWGFREINNPGYLYYSLYDAKQPLLMWVFGVSEKIFSDPLFAGRIISVLFGFLSLLGIYKVSKKLFDKKVALISALFYIVIPIFSFFDRQALMESAILTIGIWTSYFILNLFEEKNFKTAVYIGVILGIGFFIKSSALVFLFSFLIVSLYLLKISSKKTKIFEIILTSCFIFLSTIILLLINPTFWQTLSTNSRFTLTLSELLSFPFSIWITSLSTNLRILFFYLTPFVFIFSIFGIFYGFKIKRDFKIFTIFYLITFFIETFTIRIPTDRYLVSFLPVFIIAVAYFSNLLLSRFKKIGLLILVLFLALPFLLSSYQITDGAKYLLFMQKISGYSNLNYVYGSTAGFGIPEAIKYLDNKSKSQKIFVGIAENTGNPESAVEIYFNNNKNVLVTYFDARLLNLGNADCLEVSEPTYFVARDNQLAGLDKFLVIDNVIKNPYGPNTIGIYKLKTNCKGKTFKLDVTKST